MNDARWKMLYLVLVLLSTILMITRGLLKLPEAYDSDQLVLKVAAMAIAGFSAGTLVFVFVLLMHQFVAYVRKNISDWRQRMTSPRLRQASPKIDPCSSPPRENDCKPRDSVQDH